jgi:siroheme synthase-like protein
VPHFPLFIDLENLPCTVIGGGGVAVRKIQTLLEFGVRVTVFENKPSDILETLALEQKLTLVRRPYAGSETLNGARLIIAASIDQELNHRISDDAQALGIPVNVADDPAACTFFFPAIVRRGDLVAGISSSGLCPRFTARLKDELNRQWPAGWGEALNYLAAERKRLREETEKCADLVSVLDELITRLFRGEEIL